MVVRVQVKDCFTAEVDCITCAKWGEAHTHFVNTSDVIASTR